MNLKKHLLPFSPPYYNEEEEKALLDCIKRSWTGTGPKTKEFEKLFSEYKQVQFAAGLSSCTSALFLSLKALGIKKGDEVITTAMTFCSSVNVIFHCGAKPVLCDIERKSKNINVNKVEALITSKTRAIIAVHYAGYPCEMDKLTELAEKYEIYLIEDCAHAIESKYKNKHCGTFGEVGCFSFYATKNISIGEGGMAISNHESLINKISMLGLHGLSRDAWKRFSSVSKKAYDVVEIGYKMNLTDVQSSIGIVQLKRINKMRQKRKELWETYNKLLSETSLELPSLPDDINSTHALHLYACGLPKKINRDEFVWRASNEFNLTLGIHYKSIPTFSVYSDMWDLKDIEKNLPIALDWGERTISLSLSAAVSIDDCSRVVDGVTKLLKSYD